MEHTSGVERPWAMPDPVDKIPSMVLIKLSGWVEANIDAVLAPEGLKRRHYSTVSALRGGVRKGQQALAEKLRIDKATMVGVAAELEKRGYVVRERNPQDKRHYLLSATETGAEWLARTDERVGEVEDEMFGPLTAEERETLLRLMNALFLPPTD